MRLRQRRAEWKSMPIWDKGPKEMPGAAVPTASGTRPGACPRQLWAELIFFVVSDLPPLFTQFPFSLPKPWVLVFLLIYWTKGHAPSSLTGPGATPTPHLLGQGLHPQSLCGGEEWQISISPQWERIYLSYSTPVSSSCYQEQLSLRALVIVSRMPPPLLLSL